MGLGYRASGLLRLCNIELKDQAWVPVVVLSLGCRI